MIHDLSETVEDMLSDDYKRRFKAEYNQTLYRAAKLDVMLCKNKRGKLGFTPTCDVSILKRQLRHMIRYLDALSLRAKEEGIDLED